MRRARATSATTPTPSEATELAEYREAIGVLAATFARLSAGDLEPRLPALPNLPELAALRSDVNHTLDLMDAFVRESGATLAAAADGRHYRRFLPSGMPGTYAVTARQIDDARQAMHEGAAAIAAQAATRQEMAFKAVEASQLVAAAATELGASADDLHTHAQVGIDEVRHALDAVRELEASATEIQRAVTLIKRVADQTRLLALNATIEAARAGEYGRGFAVVAGEVKSLADESAHASGDITSQVDASHAATERAVATITRVASAIEEMHEQVTGIAHAASSPGGLAEVAEVLHRDVVEFSATAGA